LIVERAYAGRLVRAEGTRGKRRGGARHHSGA
jgi:hypothetical protein